MTLKKMMIAGQVYDVAFEQFKQINGDAVKDLDAKMTAVLEALPIDDQLALTVYKEDGSFKTTAEVLGALNVIYEMAITK